MCSSKCAGSQIRELNCLRNEQHDDDFQMIQLAPRAQHHAGLTPAGGRWSEGLGDLLGMLLFGVNWTLAG